VGASGSPASARTSANAGSKADQLLTADSARIESDAGVRAVAVRLLRGGSAAAERDALSVFDGHDVALRVGDRDRPRHPVGTVRNDLDRWIGQ
jgi:hypothetical protein